jgi:hypothetical protein
VGDWWAKSFTGQALNVGDTFRIEFGTTWVNFRLMLASPPTYSFYFRKIILYLLMLQTYHTEFLTGTIFNF